MIITSLTKLDGAERKRALVADIDAYAASRIGRGDAFRKARPSRGTFETEGTRAHGFAEQEAHR